MKRIIFLGSLALATIFSGCYSFSGISIDPEVRTYYVAQFKNNATNAIPGIDIIFTEGLKEKIRVESRLVYDELNPDIEFRGSIVDFRVTSEAPQPGEVVAINRLTINTSIEYINNRNSEKGWKQNFPFFFDFGSDTDLNSIQDEAVQIISDQINEDVFNKAFTDW
ncbi:MAG: LPS assembly lipoprotein LptE [Saprospiraceae bacterium]|nr:LPS assembly lipoprotein LptE [Saprospiraceae bacterium]